MSNVVSSTIFALRNVDKFENGDVGRLPVAGAQAINVFNNVTKYNAQIAKGTEGALKAFNSLAEHSKFVDYTGKAVKWATKNVNPMICMSGGVKVFMADDKPKAAITETTALATMFAGEGLMKSGALEAVLSSKPVTTGIKHLNTFKVTKPIMNALCKYKLNGKVGAIIKGALFVSGSIASYAVGQKVGEDLYKEGCAVFGKTPENINQKA